MRRPDLLRLLAPPSFTNRELHRRATTLYGVAVTLVVGGLAWIVVVAVSPVAEPALFTAPALIALLSVGVLALASAGRVQAGSWVILGAGTFLISLQLVVVPPGTVISLGAFYLLVVIAGLLGGAPATVVALVLCLAVISGFALWDGVDLVPTVLPFQSEWSVVLDNAVGLVVLTGLLIHASRRTQAAFADADRKTEELARSQDQLLRAQKRETIGTVSGALAHDFNNYLTVISGYAGLLDESSDLTPADRAAAEEILTAAAGASGLTRQLLSLGTDHAFAPEPVEVDALLRDRERMLAKLLGAHVTLEVHRAAPGSFVLADPAQLEQVLLNLCLNARDACRAGNTVRVATALTQEGDEADVAPPGSVTLTVTDDGEGMTEDVMRRAFEPFFSTKGLASGTGLGLSSVRAIVERAGGSVRLDSRPGLGTTVRCLLPTVPAPVPTSARAADRLPEPQAATVVVVEDDPLVLRLTTTILERAGYRVRGMDAPQDAVAQGEALARTADLLLTDVVMPGLSGPEVADALRRHRPDLPVLFMSGYLEGRMQEQGIVSGEVELLQKPFDRRTLLSRVAEAITRAAGSGPDDD